MSVPSSRLRQVPRLALAAFLGGLFFTNPAAARTEGDSRYTKAQTYSAALRYLRVDLGYEVTERDPDAAYLLFRYSAPGRKEPTQGSIEVVENEDRVKCWIQLPQLPSYHEVVLRDGLLAKLRADYGEPPVRKRPKEAKRPDHDAPEDGDKPADGEKPKRDRNPDGGTGKSPPTPSKDGSGKDEAPPAKEPRN